MNGTRFGWSLLGLWLGIWFAAAQAASTASTAGAGKAGKGMKTAGAAVGVDSAKAAASPEKSGAGAKSAQQPKPKDEHAKGSGKSSEKESCKATTYKLKKRPFKVEFSVDAQFESPSATEVSLHGDECTDFEVLKAVEHGTRVRQGDVLVQLNMEKIDKLIADQQRDQSLLQLSLKEAQTQLDAVCAMAPMDEAVADRAQRHSEEDWNYFVNVDRPVAQRSANFMVKMNEDFLSYEQEELRQLEKMYKADDLAEPTEEIILKRARDNVERAKYALDTSKVNRDQILKMSLPRQEETIRTNSQKAPIDHSKARALLPLAKRRAELALEKLKADIQRGGDRLQRLLADRSQMTVKAPVSGVVYYGRCTRGKWTGGENPAEKFRRGVRLMNDEVFMTILEPRPAWVRVRLSEKRVASVAAGMKTAITPTAFPDAKLTGIVQHVAGVPSSNQEFETLLTVALDDAPAGLLPGMTCEVLFTPYVKTNALTVPLDAVGHDDLDSQKSLVGLPGKGEKTEKRLVSLGKRNEKRVEILSGLAEGDEILAEFPKDKDQD